MGKRGIRAHIIYDSATCHKRFSVAKKKILSFGAEIKAFADEKKRTMFKNKYSSRMKHPINQFSYLTIIK